MRWSTPDYITDSLSILNHAAICSECTSCASVSRGWLVRAARPSWAAVQPRSRGHGCGMLSPGLEREVLLCQKPSEIRSAGLSHLHRAQRRKQHGEQKGGGGGGRREPKQACPTTHSDRKQSSVGSVSAQETSRGKVREWRREVY